MMAQYATRNAKQRSIYLRTAELSTLAKVQERYDVTLNAAVRYCIRRYEIMLMPEAEQAEARERLERWITATSNGLRPGEREI